MKIFFCTMFLLIFSSYGLESNFIKMIQSGKSARGKLIALKNRKFKNASGLESEWKGYLIEGTDLTKRLFLMGPLNDHMTCHDEALNNCVVVTYDRHFLNRKFKDRTTNLELLLGRHIDYLKSCRPCQ